MKSFCFFIISLISISSFSQELLTKKEVNINEGLKTKRGKYLKMSDYIIRYSESTPEDLHDKTILWFKENFKGDGDKILESEKGKLLRIQGSTNELLKTHKVVTTTLGYQGYRFILDIKFKYGRFKVEPVSLKTFSKDESLSEGWYERGFSNQVLNYEGEEITNGKKDMDSQLKYFNSLALGLDEFLNDSNTADDESEW